MTLKDNLQIPQPHSPHLELERRNVELALLNRVITATTSAQDPVELLTIVCRELAQIFGAPQAGAALLNEEQTSLTVVAEYLTEGGITIPRRPSSMGHVIPVAGNLATQHVLKHREPLAISDVLADPRMASVHHLMKERGTLSMRNYYSELILPLLARDEVIGTIGLDLIENTSFPAKKSGWLGTTVPQYSPIHCTVVGHGARVRQDAGHPG